MAFKKATVYESKARIALVGPAKAGKSLTSLLIASGLGSKIAAIDTEHGSLAKYAKRIDFDVVELDDFNPKLYIAAMHEAEAQGYDVLVIDSLTHAWASKGGILRQVDAAAAKTKSGSTFDAWRDPSALHTDLVEAMHASKLHIVATMRAKMAYALEQNDKGRMVPRKIGLEPVQREGMEYEFDLVGELDREHVMTVEGSRLEGFDNVRIEKPGREVGEQILAALAGERRRDRWETEQGQLGAASGMVLSELAPDELRSYLEEVEKHVRTHPELAPADKAAWRTHYAAAKQALDRTGAP
jgi:AAA domain